MCAWLCALCVRRRPGANRYGPDVPHALRTLVKAIGQQNAVGRIPQLPALCDWILALCDLVTFYHSHTYARAFQELE